MQLRLIGAIMAVITHYMAHDPISNTEGVVTDFDQDLISEASQNGIIFIAVDSNGERSVVPADEVMPPQNQDQSFIIVKPEYVDDRLKAVVDVFDALSASVPAVASNASVRAMSVNDVPMSFAEALEALREIVYATGDEGGGDE